ncbi:spore germination protein KB [Oceanobacillus oncorhynchi subsp. incaldanensis]|uniref:Spore germination protein YndE n=1 Tax=Oceanobacillus oncorhynchi TaxID=545501 RepID=A0A0A1MH63_9BACI|nr:endospore germination permease [Oceanobacillus oncorhynchi]UUI40963.1 spore germination protein [Oceanobacillus oncorhynchi]GIO18836.1 spore germination protein KB [Oceanobacillus oncorhynchi subsp. incaldanensis]CEI82408.1 Spore germination protein YndE [Oceanobacillus oncorhynchi]
MEKAKISTSQLFIVMILFQLSNSLLIPLAMRAGRDSWLAILIATAISIFLFFIYRALYLYYPSLLLTDYTEKLIGKVLGRTLAFLYILFFLYSAARVLREFGVMLLSFAFPETPLFVASALMILVVIYTIYKGIEVVARTGELLFVVMLMLAFFLFLLIAISGLIDISNLRPTLEDSPKILKTVFTETLYVPFGEIIVFTMIFPYLNQAKKLKKTAVAAISITGVALAFTTILNISVLGVPLIERSLFPLLTTIQSIEVGEFLERLDVIFILALIIGGFFKVAVYTYCALIGTASLFNIKEPSKLAYPLGITVLFTSMVIASNYSQHIEEGLNAFPIYVQLPFQIILPVFLLFIAFIKNRKK